MRKEPIRHHYIPQFILRNFSINDKNDVCYYDLKTKEIKFTKTNEIFKEDNLYRDKINFPEMPIQIEKDLAKYESEMAQLINGRFLNDSEIIITQKEEESLKLFLVLMGFRSVYAYEMFSKTMSQSRKEYYSKWQQDGNYNDFWKRNLGFLANCRSLDEVLKHPNIDDPIKIFMTRDVFALFGTFFILCEKRGTKNYILGDCYPTELTGENPIFNKMLLYDLFPISTNRIIMIAHKGLEDAPQEFILFSKKIIKYPITDSNHNVHIKVQKMYENDVESINNEIIKCSKYGYIYKD